ncbi:MAG: tyrosine-protein phosphatase [Clostridia bacterium]|nr:tyrosine-protein phosphatase [Clostridia bacterium]
MKRLVATIICISMVMSMCGCRLIDGIFSNASSGEPSVEYEEITLDANGNTIEGSNQSNTENNNADVQNNSSNNNDVGTNDNNITIDYNNAVEIDICDDTVRGYLNATTPQKQFYWLNEFSGQSLDNQTVDFDWNYDGSTQYTITISENADFSNPQKIVTNTMIITDTLFVPGRTYYWKATGTITDNALGGGKLKIKNAPVRWIKIDGTSNVRDMGGWITESGKTVKYEMMYRGKALDSITDAGKNTVKQLGLKTELDIRHAGNNPNPPKVAGMNYKFLDTHAQYDLIFASDNSPREEVVTNYKEIFKLLSDRNNYPIYTHCSAGADRTGTFAFITNGLLGVSYEDLTRDFELTSFSNSGKRWRGSGAGGTFGPNDFVMQDDSNNYVAWGELYNKMMKVYGTGDGKLSSAIERFLISGVGVPKSQIDSFKNIMLG